MKQKDYIKIEEVNQRTNAQWLYTLLSFILVGILLLGLCPLEAASKDSKGALSHKTELVKTASSINPINMIYGDGKLSAWIIVAPVNQVMNEVSRLTGVQFILNNENTTQTVSAKFRGLNLDEAIDEILHGRNYILSYIHAEKEEELTKVTILSDVSNGIEDIPSENGDYYEDAEVAEVPDGLMDDLLAMEKDMMRRPVKKELKEEMKEVNSRIGQFEMLMRSDNENVAEELMHALTTESNLQVRMSALATLTELDDVPMDIFIDIAENDPDPAIKSYAEGYLAMHKDMDPSIRANLSELSMEENMNPDKWNDF